MEQITYKRGDWPESYDNTKEVCAFIGPQPPCPICGGFGEYEDNGPKGCSPCNSRLIFFQDVRGDRVGADWGDVIQKAPDGGLMLFKRRLLWNKAGNRYHLTYHTEEARVLEQQEGWEEVNHMQVHEDAYLKQKENNPMVMSAQRGGAGPVDRRAQAAEMARQRADARQKEKSGNSLIQWKGKWFEKKAGVKNLVSVIPYIVQEKFHPEKIPQGTLWYRRPYKKHGEVGPNKIPHICTTSFNPRDLDILCLEADRLRQENWAANKDICKELWPKEREIYLFYDHDAKDIFLFEDSYAAFGDLLDARIKSSTRPGQEFWAAFYMDGGDGMALDILWDSKDIGTKNPWVLAKSIDFVPRESAPVPADVWGKAVELSTLLKRSSKEEIQKDFYDMEGDDEDSGVTGDADAPPFDQGQPVQEHINVRPTAEPKQTAEPATAEPHDPEEDLKQMDKEQLLAFAKENGLRDAANHEIHKFFRRDSEDVVYQQVKEALDRQKPQEPVKEEKPAAKTAKPGEKVVLCLGTNAAPDGTKFNDFDQCAECSEAAYAVCQVAYEALTNK